MKQLNPAIKSVIECLATLNPFNRSQKANQSAQDSSPDHQFSVNTNNASLQPKIFEDTDSNSDLSAGNKFNGKPQEPDGSHFWSASTSPVLQTLLTHAEYSDASTKDAMAIYEKYVVGSLGPSPARGGVPRWKSFMTDDFTPIEFSWSWATAATKTEPKVRFSIEPIGPSSGSISDEWNINPTMDLMKKLKENLTSLDTTMFDKLAAQLRSITTGSPKSQVLAQSASASAIFVAFELGNKEPMIKVYMHPFRCLATPQKSCSKSTVDFLAPFAREQEWKSLTRLLEFLERDSLGLGLEPFMVAFDCVPYLETRMKIYVRSPDTSYDAIERTMSLFQDRETIRDALSDLEQLYRSVFDCGTSTEGKEFLASRIHETAGILYYLDVRPNSDHVTVKVYLPVKHYAANDLKAAEGFVSYLKQKRGDQDRMIDNYLSALKEVCAHRKLADGRGLQTYISCAIKNGQLDITSYINPEIYHPARHANGLK